MKSDNLSYYENEQAFDDFHRYTSYYPRAQQALVEVLQLAPGQLVMELGSATGETTRAIARRYPQATVVGVDVRESIVAEARRLSPAAEFPNLSFQAADMGRWDTLVPWQGRWPDVVCWLYAYHHLSDPLRAKQEHARQMAASPGPRRVVILDEVIQVGFGHPDYYEATRRQWEAVSREAYRSVRLNRYLSLLAQGVPSAEARDLAEQAGQKTRDIELTIGEATARRDDEYPVCREEMLTLWQEAGYRLEFENEVNGGLDWLFVWEKA